MEQTTLKKKENFNAVDIAKFIFAFGVVSIHTFFAFFDNPFINSIIDSVIIRLGVPFFFVSSGFFFFRDIVFENGRIKKCPENRVKLFSFLKRTLILYCVWTVIYMVWNIYTGIFKYGYDLIELIKAYIPDFFLDGVSDHFWYLVFMMYAIFLLYFALRFIRLEIIGGIACVFFLSFLYGHTYCNFFGIKFLKTIVFSVLYIRIPFTGLVLKIVLLYIALGFLFVGLICVKLREKIGLKTSGIVALLFFCLSLAENMVIRGVLGKGPFSYTIFLVPTALFGFIFLSKVKLNGNAKIFSFFRKSSTFIYCSHFLVCVIFDYCTDMNYKGTIVKFLVVSLISLVLSCLIVFLSDKIKLLKKLY